MTDIACSHGIDLDDHEVIEQCFAADVAGVPLVAVAFWTRWCRPCSGEPHDHHPDGLSRDAGRR